MAVIAVLNTLVQADTSAFEKGMAKAELQTGKFAAASAQAGKSIDQGWGVANLFGLKSVLGGLAGPIVLIGGAALAAGVAVGGFALGLHALASHGAASIASLSQLSRQLGISTQAIATFAAGGIDPDAFGTATIHMQRALQDLGKEAQQALSALNLDPEALRAQSAEQQIRSIAGAFSGLTNQGERASVAMALFGRGGIAMIDMLSRGTAGLDAAAERAQRFGLTFTQAQADAVRAANREWRNFGMAFEGISRQAAGLFAPLWEAVGKVGGAIGETLVGMFRAAMPVMQEVIGWLTGKFNDLLPVVRSVGTWITEGLVVAFRAAVPWLRFAAETLDAILRAAFEVGRAMAGFVLDSIRAVGVVMAATFTGDTLLNFSRDWEGGWQRVKEVALVVLAHISVGATRWKEVFSAAVDWVRLKFLELKRSTMEYGREFGEFALRADRMMNPLSRPMSWLGVNLAERFAVSVSPQGIGAVTTEINALRAGMRNFSDSIGHDVDSLVRRWMNELNGVGQQVIHNIEQVQEEQPQQGGGAGHGQHSGDLPLANSAAANRLLFAGRGDQEALMRAQLNSAEAQVRRLENIQRAVERAGIVRRAR